MVGLDPGASGVDGRRAGAPPLTTAGSSAIVLGMRPFCLALAAALGLVLGSAPAGAADPPRITLEVGASVATGGYSGRCDDLSVASITIGPNATLTALQPGKTLCSWASGHVDGLRLVVEVVVVEAKRAPAK